MNVFKKIKTLLTYTEVSPLIYDKHLQEAYSTTSVTGGSLKGKTAVVTGATSGIGYATAQRLLNEKCNVTITGRNEEKLKETVSSLTHDAGIRLDYLQMDNLDPQSVRDAVCKAFQFAQIDLWVNCAGIFIKTDRERKFRGIEAETYFEVINTNLKSTVLATKLVADEMVNRGIDGQIINVASICGYSRNYGHIPYGISKTAVIEYTKLLAEDYKGKVNIKAIAPGSVATKMGTTGFGKSLSGGNSVTKHVAMPEETAAVICFLASPIGKYLNGDTVVASALEIV